MTLARLCYEGLKEGGVCFLRSVRKQRNSVFLMQYKKTKLYLFYCGAQESFIR